MVSGRKVAVVILGWNGKKYLEQFLPSVVQHTDTNLCEIIVADNMSTDGSVEFVKEHYPSITIIQNTRNGGYAGGYNDALKNVDAEYYVLLNQDIEVSAGWVERVIEEMERDNNIAAAQPKLRSYYQPTHFEYAGASGGYMDKFIYAFCRGRVFDTLEEDKGQYEDVADIFWATGACLFIRSKDYWAAGALDEDFFAHQEEVDLCWRLKSLGKRNIVVPQSVVYHVGGGSLPQGNPRKTYLNFRNSLMMMFKNLPPSTLWWLLPFRLILDDVAAFHSIKKDGNFNSYKAIYKARWHFFKALPSLIEKRKAVPVKSSHHLYHKSVMWQYFINGRKTFNAIVNP